MEQLHKEKMRKSQIWMPLLLALAAVVGMMIGMRLQKPSPITIIENGRENLKTGNSGGVEELIRYIESRYVDEVDHEELTEVAINAIIDRLDPHSSYIPARDLQAVNENLEGNFDGIGIEFFILDDTLFVVSPLVGGPAETAGLLAGDRIVMVEDSLIAGKDKDVRELTKMLRGKKQSEVHVGVLRNGEQELLEFTIIRAAIPMPSLDVAMMLDDKTGYIRLNRFSAKTYEEFMEALEVLVEDKKMEDLVLDLRGNPGGYLLEATKLLSQLFTEKQALLVFTEGRKTGRNDYSSSGMPFFNVDDIVVLIDGGSASASEIVAGAIQDKDRGIIVGRRSFGKGLVQEQYDLSDGSALRLTVARYYTPSGRSIQKPYDVDAPENYAHDGISRLESGELLDKNKIEITDSTQYHTTKGYVVYGGGGIIPDVFVPLDTSMFSGSYTAMQRQIRPFVYNLFSNPPAEWAEHTLTSFKNNYTISDKLFNQYMDRVEKEVETIDEDEFAKCESHIKLLLKARMARHLFGDEGLYSILNEDDDMIKETLRVLHLPNPLVSVKNK